MKLGRLATREFQHIPDTAPQATPADVIRRVEATAATGGERERSLREELASVVPEAGGTPEEVERVRAEAHELALQVTELGDRADTLLLKPDFPRGAVPPVDESA